MWRCPKCKASIRIFDVRTTIVTYPDGTEVAGDVEWVDGNQAECVSCTWKGTAGEAYDETAAPVVRMTISGRKR